MQSTGTSDKAPSKTSFDRFSFHYFDSSVYFYLHVDVPDGSISVGCQGTAFSWGIPEYTWDFPVTEKDMGFFEAVLSHPSLNGLTEGMQGEKGWDLTVERDCSQLRVAGSEMFSQEFLNYLRYFASEKVKDIVIDFSVLESVRFTDSSLKKVRTVLVENDGYIESVANKKRQEAEDSEQVVSRWNEIVECISSAKFPLVDLKRGTDLGKTCELRLYFEDMNVSMLYDGCIPDGWPEFCDAFLSLTDSMF